MLLIIDIDVIRWYKYNHGADAACTCGCAGFVEVMSCSQQSSSSWRGTGHCLQLWQTLKSLPVTSKAACARIFKA